MGHVDHPEQAEGDRQAERGQQQDAPQAQAAEGLAEQFAEQQLALDLRQAGFGGLAHGGVGFSLVGQQVFQPHPGKRCASFAKQAHGGQAYRGIASTELQIGECQCQGLAHGRVVFGFKALLEQAELFWLAAALEALGGTETLRRFLGKQLVAGQRRIQQATQAVVQAQLLRRAVGFGLAFEGAVAAVLLDEGGLVAVDGDAVGAQRFDQLQALGYGRDGPAFQQFRLLRRAGAGIVGCVSGLRHPGQGQQEQQEDSVQGSVHLCISQGGRVLS